MRRILLHQNTHANTQLHQIAMPRPDQVTRLPTRLPTTGLPRGAHGGVGGEESCGLLGGCRWGVLCAVEGLILLVEWSGNIGMGSHVGGLCFGRWWIGKRVSGRGREEERRELCYGDREEGHFLVFLLPSIEKNRRVGFQKLICIAW